MTTMTIDEKLTKATEVSNELKAAKTADDVRKIHLDNFATLGHKVLGRMHLGRTPEQALKITN